MLTYIENLKNEYLQTNDEKVKNEILDKLMKEKEYAMNIINKYLSGEYREWEKCKKVCDHEKEIIQKIENILDSFKK